MKICVISNLYEPFHVGGAEAVAKIQVEELIKKGHDVFVITTKPSGNPDCENKNYKIYRFKPLNLFYYKDLSKHNSFVKIIWHFFDIFNLHSKKIVKGILTKEKPEIVITHNLKGIGYLIPKIIRKLKIKHIHNLHDVQLSNPSGLLIKGEENSFIANGLLTKIYERICKSLFSSIQTVISPSKWLLDFYKNKNFFRDSDCHVIANPVETNSDLQLKSAKTNTFLFLGQMEKFKGINWLIKFLQKESIKDSLIVVGDGTEFEKLKEKQFQNIKLLGRVEKEKLNKIFSLVDFLIVPSLCYESFGKVIIDAYAQSIPVIAREGGGVDELIDDEKTGFLYESDDEFKQRLRKINYLAMENYNLLQKNCFSKSKQFSVESYIERLKMILKS